MPSEPKGHSPKLAGQMPHAAGTRQILFAEGAFSLKPGNIFHTPVCGGPGPGIQRRKLIFFDSKVKAKFEKMKRAEWLAYLAEAKVAKVAADKAKAKEATKEARRNKKRSVEEEQKKRRHGTEGSSGQRTAAKRHHESDSSSDTPSDSEEERHLKRKLKKIRTKKGIELEVEEDKEEHTKEKGKRKAKAKALSSKDLNRD
ncbi:hypothetical protein B0H10DRAFT_1961351 [Mycena sp. CBHHK59/15]|nr:hypothetical protein B0H10DRAFT_1961351 [Mycena sp. CBHHK59/15]